MEYPDGCSTAMTYVAKKVGLYDLEVVSPWKHYFRTGGLVYDIYLVYSSPFQAYDLTLCDMSCDLSHMSLYCQKNT